LRKKVAEASVDAKEKDSMTAAMPLMGVLAGLKQAGAEVRNSSLKCRRAV